MTFIQGTFSASPHLHGSPIYCTRYVMPVTKIWNTFQGREKYQYKVTPPVFPLESSSSLSDFPLHRLLVLICLSPSPWVSVLRLSLHLTEHLSLSLSVYLYIYVSPRLLTHSFSLKLPSPLTFLFSLPLSWCYPLVSPDAAKLIRTHPINSGPAYAGTSWGVCRCVCVSSARDAVRMQCTDPKLVFLPLRRCWPTGTNSSGTGERFVIWWQDREENWA